MQGAGDVRDALLAAYSEAGRAYHDRRHLGEVLDRLDELAASGARFDPIPVRLAAWFHDAVYDGRPGAEERSAAWAREALGGLVDPVVAVEVERLVLLTADHQVSDGDRNGAALCDADLAILASPPARYAQYAADVRKEYSHLADEQFAAGRGAVLRGLARREALYATSHGREHWEPAARDNIARELTQLR